MELVKEGVYFGIIESAGLEESETTGAVKAIIRVNFETEEGKRISLNWYGGFTTPKSGEYTKKTIHDLGGMLLATAGRIEIELGKKVKITIEHNNYNGKVSPKIKYINSASTKFKGVSPEKLSALAWVDGITVDKQESDIPF